MEAAARALRNHGLRLLSRWASSSSHGYGAPVSARPAPVGLLLFLTLLGSTPAWAQHYVVPRRPGQSVVRHFPHDWHTVDVLKGEEVRGETAGGVQLFWYEEERESAGLAVAAVEQAYRELADDFDFTPPEYFPYVLYSSYQEFLRTNLFPLQEGTLGVTSPRSLEVTLPYFGDHRSFAHVSKHELAHQFTIQKVRARTRDASAYGDPLSAMPLWFVEGLAEYYAQDGLDLEARLLLADMVANPDIYRGYGVPWFFDDDPTDFLWTYKVGQARCAFLEETYGEGTVQQLLERSPDLVAAGMFKGRKVGSFRKLVEDVTGDDPVVVSARFDSWIKRTVLPGWLSADLDPGRMEPFVEVQDRVDGLDASPDGSLVAYRTMERRTGRMRLVLVDPDDARHGKVVVRDGVPGAESLHPVDPRSFDLADSPQAPADLPEGEGHWRMTWVAESRGRDVLHWAEVTRRPRGKAKDDPELEERRKKVRVKVFDTERERLSGYGLVAASSPVLSPDGTRIAFVGLSDAGRRDLYVLDTTAASGDRVRKVTDDLAAERQVAWGPQGLVFTSDATSDRRYNLFRIDPDAAPGTAPERLTTQAGDQHGPVVLPDGRLLFSALRASDEGGAAHNDVFELTPDGVVRRTDATTALSNLAQGPEAGALWGLLYDAGRQWPVRLDEDVLIDEPVPDGPDATGDPGLPVGDLSGAQDYSALKLGNWGLENVFALLGAGGGAVWGQAFVSATDVLRDHALILSASVYGRLDLADAYLLYLDQSKRITWGGGAFSSLRYRVDDTFVDEGVRFQAGQRYYGGLVTARYPFDRFLHLQLDQTVGAVDHFLFDSTAEALSDPELNEAGRDLLPEWQSIWDAPRLQSETTLRLGYDTIGYHPATGPLTGGSVLLEGSLGVQPVVGEVYQSVRVDAEGYLPLDRNAGASFLLRGAAGASGGAPSARSFYLYGPYTLRGVAGGDPDFLLGRHFWVTTSEVQIPLSWLVRVAFLSSVEGIVGADFGAAADDPLDLWDQRVLDLALGTNMAIGPLLFRLHFATPVDIGAPLPDNPRAWVTNFSLGWVGE